MYWKGTTVTLAKEGVKIVVTARRVKEGDETVRLVKQNGSGGIFVKTNMANENDVRLLVERLDYAFNNISIGDSRSE